MINVFGPGDDYAGRPGPQGDDTPGCLFAAFEIVAAVIVLVTLLAGRSHAQEIGPAPCHSDTPAYCYPHQLYFPLAMHQHDDEEIDR